MAGRLDGEFTVPYIRERLGQQVFVVEGTVTQQGTEIDVQFEVTEDYVNLGSMTCGKDFTGQVVETTFEMTEWDAAQSIVAPM